MSVAILTDRAYRLFQSFINIVWAEQPTVHSGGDAPCNTVINGANPV